MATHREIRAALLEKLGVTKQRLSQLAKARKAQLPMSTEHAVYTIAHDNGIDIAAHLSKEETAEVRRLIADLARNGPAIPAKDSSSRKGRGAQAKKVTVRIQGLPDGLVGMAGSHAREAKTMAERVYPRLYLFENSLRDLIERVLKAKHGDDWWEKAVTKKVRDTATGHRAGEAKDPWHGKRGGREIDYVFLSQLWDIIKHNWKDFTHLFPNQAWIEGLIANDMNVSRRVVAHMNPLADDDVANIEAAFRKWAKQLKAIEPKLP